MLETHIPELCGVQDQQLPDHIVARPELAEFEQEKGVLGGAS